MIMTTSVSTRWDELLPWGCGQTGHALLWSMINPAHEVTVLKDREALRLTTLRAMKINTGQPAICMAFSMLISNKICSVLCFGSGRWPRRILKAFSEALNNLQGYNWNACRLKLLKCCGPVSRSRGKPAMLWPVLAHGWTPQDLPPGGRYQKQVSRWPKKVPISYNRDFNIHQLSGSQRTFVCLFDILPILPSEKEWVWLSTFLPRIAELFC